MTAPLTDAELDAIAVRLANAEFTPMDTAKLYAEVCRLRAPVYQAARELADAAVADQTNGGTGETEEALRLAEEAFAHAVMGAADAIEAAAKEPGK
jgi:hypothetical protein